jgi:hypothetical protein
MAKQSFQMHLYIKENPYKVEPGPEFRLLPWGPTSNVDNTFGIYVGPATVEAEVPDSFDMRAAKLAAKQAELEKVRAELGARVTQLMREISELQAIEYAPAEVARPF